MRPPTSSHSSAREPTDAVLLTVMESALLRLLERGLDAAAEESIRRVMAQSQSQQPPHPTFVAGAGAPWAPEAPSKGSGASKSHPTNIIPFPRSTTSCGND